MIIKEVRVDITLVTSPLRTTPIIIQQTTNVRQHKNIKQHDHNVQLQMKLFKMNRL